MPLQRMMLVLLLLLLLLLQVCAVAHWCGHGFASDP
jgi:hypothetical protein